MPTRPTPTPDVSRVAGNPVPELEDFLFLFFEPSTTSQLAGKAFWERRHARTRDVDPPTSKQTALSQREALTEWDVKHGERYAELRDITQPTLAVNGNHDIMLPTINSYILAQHIAEAQLIVYPDSGHGSLFQYPKLFVDDVSRSSTPSRLSPDCFGLREPAPRTCRARVAHKALARFALTEELRAPRPTDRATIPASA
jgi:pimeloyl-ACP methyl ester carboxylesterase